MKSSNKINHSTYLCWSYPFIMVHVLWNLHVIGKGECIYWWDMLVPNYVMLFVANEIYHLCMKFTWFWKWTSFPYTIILKVYIDVKCHKQCRNLFFSNIMVIIFTNLVYATLTKVGSSCWFNQSSPH